MSKLSAQTQKQEQFSSAKSRANETRSGKSFQHVQRPMGNRAVQRMIQGPAKANSGRQVSESVHEAAQHGIQGTRKTFPHLSAIQRAFGHHDITRTVAHEGPEATRGARAMGASAFTVGNHAAFASAPDLHTAAHEAAHIVQQRGGVQLKGNVGRTGDLYERHADAVADRVVRGQSSEKLLDTFAPRGQSKQANRSSGDAIQMKKVPTAFGSFEDIYYHQITNSSDEPIGCEMYLRFTPGDTVDATKIGLVQTVKSVKEGTGFFTNDTKKKQAVTSGKAKDYKIDMYASARSPVYGAGTRGTGDAGSMEGWDLNSKVTPMTDARKATEASGGMKGVKYDGMGQYGFRKKSGADWNKQAAELDDWPVLPDTVGKKDSGQTFETTALAISGNQKDAYYGSVQWGWQRDNKAAFKLVDFNAVSQGTPSSIFMASAEKWNTSKASGGENVIKLPTVEVYTTSKEMDVLFGADKAKLPANTRVRVVSKGATAKDPWNVKIVDGPNTGKDTSLDGTTLTKETN
jgi:hypothetical protein